MFLLFNQRLDFGPMTNAYVVHFYILDHKMLYDLFCTQATIIDLAFFGQRPCVINVIYHSLADDMLFSSMRSVVFKFSIKLCFGHCFRRKVFRYFPFLIASQLGTHFKLIFKAKEIANSFKKKFLTSAAVILDS